MQFHITLARALIRLGSFIQSSAVMVMPSDDLVEFGRQLYSKPKSIEFWNSDGVIDGGLNDEERQLLERIPIQKGKLLLLGLGGGREAIPFAKMGFDVTGVDFIPSMVEGAISNAKRRHAHIKGIVADITSVDMPAEKYDIVWFSTVMYSGIPTRARRVLLFRRIQRAIKPGGYLVCQFQWDVHRQFSHKAELLCRIIARLTLGNRTYEPGDRLWANTEFNHAFSSENDLTTEFSAAGFQVAWLNIPADTQRCGGVILQKLEA